MRNNKVKNIAFSSMFVALSVVTCLLASFFATMSLTITAIASVFSAVAIVQCGYKYAGLVYAAASVLVFLLVPNRECAVYYILFFGHYPIVKVFLERIGNRFFRWGAKLLIGNILFVVSLWLLIKLIGINAYTGNVELMMLVALLNVAFVLYDILISRIVAVYIGKRFGKGGFN